MKVVTTEQQFDELISTKQLTVAVYKADWCKDCHFIDPFMPDVEAKYADNISFIVIDRDALPELSERYHIMGIPSFIAFREGKEIVRYVNKLRKTRDEIEQFLDRALLVSAELA